jgi:hypothetical protein
VTFGSPGRTPGQTARLCRVPRSRSKHGKSSDEPSRTTDRPPGRLDSPGATRRRSVRKGRHDISPQGPVPERRCRKRKPAIPGVGHGFCGSASAGSRPRGRPLGRSPRVSSETRSGEVGEPHLHASRSSVPNRGRTGASLGKLRMTECRLTRSLSRPRTPQGARSAPASRAARYRRSSGAGTLPDEATVPVARLLAACCEATRVRRTTVSGGKAGFRSRWRKQVPTLPTNWGAPGTRTRIVRLPLGEPTTGSPREILTARIHSGGSGRVGTRSGADKCPRTQAARLVGRDRLERREFSSRSFGSGRNRR